ncbi:MAG: sulfurtransferase [Candidatus Diapherotrites archaeon CG10_big_fil_rev_8_21_14_0_10_31_34]|nr:MAG: sulfurtransferase [Candidatus Diapherotrites archaeon CG10_big_fil_rev_8_21_14_0_10_31_34]
MKTITIGAIILLLLLVGCVNTEPKAQTIKEKDKQNNEQKISFTDISAQELKQKLENKDFFLLDVHVPEQEHIKGTDEFIAFDKIEENIDKLPKNKETLIVVYCRSGNMNITASEKLVELGYKNVMNLEGGIKAFNSLE